MSDLVGTQIAGFLTHRLICLWKINGILHVFFSTNIKQTKICTTEPTLISLYIISSRGRQHISEFLTQTGNIEQLSVDVGIFNMSRDVTLGTAGAKILLHTNMAENVLTSTQYTRTRCQYIAVKKISYNFHI